jgi:hypothetical protein
LNALAIHRDQMNEQSRAGHARGDCSVHTPDQGQDTAASRGGGFVIGGISSRAGDAIVASLLNLAGLIGLGRFSRFPRGPLMTGAGRLLCLGGSPSLRHNCGRRLTGCRRSFILKMSNHFDRQVTDCSENHSLHSVAAVSMSNHRTGAGAVVRKSLGKTRNE